MFRGAIKNIFDTNTKKISQLDKTIDRIVALEETISNWSFDEFQTKTKEYQERFSSLREVAAEEREQTLNEILPEAFAMVREVAARVINEKTFREQLLVGIVLHEGGLAEQKTGEGKTHAAVHPTYLNALLGKGAHIVTVNDYLARRDAEWMGPIYHMLGLTVGVINSQNTSYIYEPPLEVTQQQFPLSPEYKNNTGTGKYLREVSRREAYQCDVTYGTNNEFGFDYLRDNMVQSFEQVVQTNPQGEFGAHHFVVVDEADSILIDEARTPLIISAPAQESNELYGKFSRLIPSLNSEDYVLDEKSKSAHLTDLGVKKIEQKLGVANVYEDFQLAHHLDQALKAQFLYLKDRDYVVKDGEVLIVDTFTGRLMPGRRYSEGLHQALEAKENVAIQKESKTLATITFQNYFRLYQKLSGMSATIMTEAEEFYKIYHLSSVAIPTHRPVVRQDYADRIYKNQRAKWKAIVDEIESVSKAGQPILAGTTSVEKNELLSGLLKRRGIKHEVLNAKNHQREADIIANAGQKGAVTIATNMAGRGTDIKLSQEVKEAGGLHVIGTERHEARRIDNQLRGRSGRQGDPGSSRFFVALDDDLMRIFNGDKIAGLMTRFNLPEDMPIEANIVSRSIENSQKKVESYNFDIRKHLVEYDDVINRQREIIYERRRRLLRTSEDKQLVNTLKDQLMDKMRTYVDTVLMGITSVSDPDFDAIYKELEAFLNLTSEEKKTLRDTLPEGLGDLASVRNYVEELVTTIYQRKEQEVGTEQMRRVERVLLLSTIDYYWMEHIDALEELRYGVRLRAYGQRDPLIEFKNEAFRMFEQLLTEIDYEVIHRLFKVQIVQQLAPEILEDARAQHKQLEQFDVQESAVTTPASLPDAPVQPITKTDEEKIGRNDPCWCGSGKKYKVCGLKDTPEHQRNLQKN